MARIGFLGDVYPGRDGALTVSAAVAELLAGFDLVVANLESPITAVSEPVVEKGTHLRSEPGSESLLSELSIEVVTLANNHMFDFGREGFASTARVLDTAGTDRVGAGFDLAAARRSLIREVGDQSVGFLAYSGADIETMIAAPDTAGCAPLDREVMAADLERLRDSVDLAVVLVHWGLMGHELPRPRHFALGADLVDLGADLVIGCHPHVVQGVREVGNGLVAYSLGDFAFYPRSASGRAVNQYRARQTGLILDVEVAGGRVAGYRTHLTRQKETFIEIERSGRRRRRLRLASRRVDTTEGAYGRVWRGYVIRRTAARLVKRLAPWRWKTIRPGTVRGFGVALREIFRRRA